MSAARKKNLGRYSKVYRRMWNDEGFRSLSSAPPNAQTLWLRLLTGPELTAIPGLFPAWEAGLAQALRWPIEGFRLAFAEVLAKGMAEADWEAGVVYVPKAVEYNPPESLNVVIGWAKAFDDIPECPLKEAAFREVDAYVEALGDGFARAFRDAIGKASPNQEQEQDTGAGSKNPPRAGVREGRSSAPSAFDVEDTVVSAGNESSRPPASDRALGFVPASTPPGQIGLREAETAARTRFPSQDGLEGVPGPESASWGNVVAAPPPASERVLLPPPGAESVTEIRVVAPSRRGRDIGTRRSEAADLQAAFSRGYQAAFGVAFTVLRPDAPAFDDVIDQNAPPAERYAWAERAGHAYGKHMAALEPEERIRWPSGVKGLLKFLEHGGMKPAPPSKGPRGPAKPAPRVSRTPEEQRELDAESAKLASVLATNILKAGGDE